MWDWLFAITPNTVTVAPLWLIVSRTSVPAHGIEIAANGTHIGGAHFESRICAYIN